MEQETAQDETSASTELPTELPAEFQLTKFGKSSNKNLIVSKELYEDWIPQTKKSPSKPAKSLDWLVEEVLEENTAALKTKEAEGNKASGNVEASQLEVPEFVRKINVTTNDIIIIPTEPVDISNLIYPVIDDLYKMGQVACAALLGKLFTLGLYECEKIDFMIGVSEKLSQEQHEAVIAKAFDGFKETAAAINANIEGPIVFVTRHCMLGGHLTATRPLNHFVFPNNSVVGDVLVLTKPLGVQLTLEAFKIFEGAQTEKRERLCRCVSEEDLRKSYNDAILSMTTLNLQPCMLAANYEVRTLIEVNGKSLMEYVKEIAQLQTNEMTLYIYNLPLISKVATVSKLFSKHAELMQGNLPEIAGGLLILMPREQAAAYCKSILNGPDRAWIIGVAEPGNRTAKIIKKPRLIEWLSSGGVGGGAAVDPKVAFKNDIVIEGV